MGRTVSSEAPIPGIALCQLGLLSAVWSVSPMTGPSGRQGETIESDWQRLRDLFAESAAARQDDLWDLHAPDLPRGSDGAADGTVDSVARSGLNVTVSATLNGARLRSTR
jgi:hypothetical protein